MSTCLSLVFMSTCIKLGPELVWVLVEVNTSASINLSTCLSSVSMSICLKLVLELV